MKIRFIAILTILLVMISCKPTEKNYHDAYDKAYEAAQRKNKEFHTGSTGEILEDMNAPRHEQIGDLSLHFATGRMTPFETTLNPEGGKMGIAIGHYAVPTNARHHLQDIRKEYEESFIATDGDENYYIVIERVDSKEEAASKINEFITKHPDYRYIGMMQNPVVISLYIP